ncbi:MAG TPA: SRPBCC domain-containing protein, partial [Actinoplanes sp.]|nr:SRPBCC domain-containing protein [Actinoplanes sp.]
MMPEIRWTRVIRRPRPELWRLFFDADAAKVWLGVVGYVMPEHDGAPFCWLFDPGGPKPTAFVGRLLAVEPLRRIDMLWELSSCAADTRLSWEFDDHGAGETIVVLRHTNFPSDGLGPFEHDGYAHHWGHILDGLEAYAHGSPRDTLRRHGAMIGLVPVGAVAGKGLLIKDIIHGTPAENAGLRPG